MLDVNPKNAQALNYYGYMLADRGMRLDEARDMIQRALDQEPLNGAYLDSLGWVYFKQNKLEDAEAALRKAVEREPHDPTIRSHLGDVLRQARTHGSGGRRMGKVAGRMAPLLARRPGKR